MRRNKLVTIGTVLLVAGVLLGMELGSFFSEGDTYAALKKLENAFLVINERYVEEVDSAELAESALEGILKDLDPHSIYIDAERMRRVQEDFSGGFEGIGISYELIQGPSDRDTITVLSVIPGGPSEEVGLMSGDRIVKIDGASAIGFDDQEVQGRLKGKRGTKVDVTLQRPGYTGDIEVTITRDRIPLYSVDAAYMLDDRTGYIKVNRFARTTYREFMEGLMKLKAEGMEQLILDLRGNAGGYMDIAVEMSDEFLAEGELIVSQRGRAADTNHEFFADPRGTWEDKPVIVLVDGSSASASEIVAGALQDHDRGLIVGRRTFGKGLVQQQYALTDGSALRVTISRYYTPSGRLIQSPYKDGDREDYYRIKREMRSETASMSIDEILSLVPDSLKYTTDNGRTVIGGGGILPDYQVEIDTASTFVMTVISRSLDNLYVRSWLDQEGEALRSQWGDARDTFIRDFMVDGGTYDAFLTLAQEHGLEIVDGEVPAEEVGKKAGRHVFSRAEVEADRAYMETRLKARLAVRLFDYAAWYEIMQGVDRTIQEARALWSHAAGLEGLSGQ